MSKTDVEPLITKYAERISSEAEDIVDWADSEADVRHELSKLIDAFLSEAGINLRGRHEYQLAGGRIDSKYAGVLFEYKYPAGRSKIGSSCDGAGAKAVESQLTRRFHDFADTEGIPLEKLFAVGIDGEHAIFATYRKGEVRVEPPVPVTPYNCERILRALVSLGAEGKNYTPENLAEDFGVGSSLAAEGIQKLYKSVTETDDPKALTLFDQWEILFQEVSGYSIEGSRDKIQRVADEYGIEGEIEPAKLLYALHSFYALFMKLLAAEIASSVSPLSISIISDCAQSDSYETLRSLIKSIEQGGVWSELGISNFLEGDVFSWYVPAWNDEVGSCIQALARGLDQYDETTLSVDPEETRDLLKHLYQRLFPNDVRHDLGEYYTPDWLAQHTLDQSGYQGDPDHRLLDPACGSGTFLVLAINYIREWYSKHHHSTSRLSKKDLAEKILANVIGFDLNPLAVMAARTNFLLAIRDLLPHVGQVEIPVYLCDSVVPPRDFSSDVATFRFRRLETAVGPFKVPKEVLTDRSTFAVYIRVLQQCLEADYEADEFLDRCAAEGVPVSERGLHSKLFEKVRGLRHEGRDGIWVRIIKNNFAPLFLESVDYVVGNPPWIFWNNLPKGYRDLVQARMVDGYGIMSGSASTMKQLGAAGKDISMLFFYSCIDEHLEEDGKLAFVITQTVFQSEAGSEFRRFRLPDGLPICVERVVDWVNVEPFRRWAANKTCVLVARKGSQTEYPVPYPRYSAIESFDREQADLEEVLEACSKEELVAEPSNKEDRTSVWRLRPQGSETEAASIYGASATLTARRGVEATPVTAFRVHVREEVGDGLVLVENDTTRAKKPVPTQRRTIEVEFLWPFMAGRSLGKWTAGVAGYYVVPHTRRTAMSPVTETDLKTNYPGTYRFLHKYREILEDRSIHKRWGGDHPFFAVYNVGRYTFAPYKVAWARRPSRFSVAVSSTIEDDHVGTKVLIPDGSVMIVPFEQPEPAYFLSGVLNSSFARRRIDQSITGNAGQKVLDVVPIPALDLDEALHQELVSWAQTAHQAAMSNMEEELRRAEVEIDRLAGRLWGIEDSAMCRFREELD